MNTTVFANLKVTFVPAAENQNVINLSSETLSNKIIKTFILKCIGDSINQLYVERDLFTFTADHITTLTVTYCDLTNTDFAFLTVPKNFVTLSFTGDVFSTNLGNLPPITTLTSLTFSMLKDNRESNKDWLESFPNLSNYCNLQELNLQNLSLSNQELEKMLNNTDYSACSFEYFGDLNVFENNLIHIPLESLNFMAGTTNNISRFLARRNRISNVSSEEMTFLVKTFQEVSLNDNQITSISRCNHVTGRPHNRCLYVRMVHLFLFLELNLSINP